MTMRRALGCTSAATSATCMNWVRLAALPAAAGAGGAEGSRRVPQLPQKRIPAGTGAWHDGQTIPMLPGVPEALNAAAVGVCCAGGGLTAPPAPTSVFTAPNAGGGGREPAGAPVSGVWGLPKALDAP